MEMHQGRRPVYGGAPRQPPKIAANATTRGVQGSCGPLVGGRRIETAGPLVLSVMKEQRYVEKLSKRRPSSQTRRLAYKTTPARANKEKSNARGTAGCGVSRRVGGVGKPVRPILATSAAGRGAGFPAKPPPPQAPGRVTDPPLQRKGKRRTGAARGVPGGRSPPWIPQK